MRYASTPWPPMATDEKPMRGALINWDNPLTVGLASYLLFNEHSRGGDVAWLCFDMVSRAVGQAAANLVTVGHNPSPLGRAYSFTGGATSRFDFLPVNPFGTGGWNGLTCAAKLRYNSSGTMVSVSKGPSAGGSGFSLQNGQFTGGEVNFTCVDVNVNGPASPLTNDDVWRTYFGTWTRPGPVRLTCYEQTGVQRYQITGSALSALTDGGGLRIAGYNDATTAMFTGDIEWVGLWSRGLTDAEMEDLGASPYRMIRRAMAPRMFFLPAPAASGSATLTADVGAFSLAGQSVLFDVKMPTVGGAFTHTGQAATFGVGMTSSVGSFTDSGQAATFAVTLAASKGTFTLTGQDVTLTDSGAGAVTLRTMSLLGVGT